MDVPFSWSWSRCASDDNAVPACCAPHATGTSAIVVVALGQTAREDRVCPFRSRIGRRLDALFRRDR
jgi:hypothetical protein